jgi:hypothetical protein
VTGRQSVDQGRKDLAETGAEEVMALVRIDEDAAVRERRRQLQRMLDGYERIARPVP